jgi:hypothetical protein
MSGKNLSPLFKVQIYLFLRPILSHPASSSLYISVKILPLILYILLIGTLRSRLVTVGRILDSDRRICNSDRISSTDGRGKTKEGRQ